MLTDEQAKQIKQQLLQQIENFPPEQKEIAKQQITAMNKEQLEDFLIKNKLIKGQAGTEGTTEAGTSNEETLEQAASTTQAGQQCVFCLINEGKIETTKIDENKKAIAILEINPISRGHAIVIPKKHVATDKMPSSALGLAKKIAKKLKSKLKPKPKNIEITTSSMFGHGIINIIPIYKDETPSSERKKASPEQLKEILEKLTKKTEKLPIKTETEEKTAEKIKEKSKKSKKPIKLEQAPLRLP